MVRLIMGVKGSGKTKQLIELINNAAKDEPGNVVCIEANCNMTYDIHYHIRLIDAQEYKLNSYQMMRGFISGLYAGNYDISQVFIDNLSKIVGVEIGRDTEEFLNWLDAFGEKNNIKFTITISGDLSLATEGMQKFL
ncbi:MAG: ATP-binding protein [Oscillibacter sp.]